MTDFKKADLMTVRSHLKLSRGWGSKKNYNSVPHATIAPFLLQRGHISFLLQRGHLSFLLQRGHLSYLLCSGLVFPLTLNNYEKSLPSGSGFDRSRR